MKILVINAGSSSLKYKLFNMENVSVMAGGIVERISEENSIVTHKVFFQGQEKQFVKKEKIKDHKRAMYRVADMIIDPENGVVDDISKIDAIGHRVVQGGEAFGSSVLIDEAVKQAIKENIALAPLHNPANLSAIEVAQKIFLEIPNIAVFDTEFHQSLPQKAYLYGIPYTYYETYRVRKYGFHGTSHKYVASEAAALMGKRINETNLITMHLGNGCSICAVKNGRCVDTSMGMTPLAGVMMGTRSGDIDPSITSYLMDQTCMDAKAIYSFLNKKSGLKGICGLNDLRDIHEQVSKGNTKAGLAVAMFSYQIKKYIGSYLAVLGNVHALVFTAGVGENDDIVRSKVCENLSTLGIDIDSEKNHRRMDNPFSIHKRESRIQVWVIPTNEELQIAREAVQVLG